MLMLSIRFARVSDTGIPVYFLARKITLACCRAPLNCSAPLPVIEATRRNHSSDRFAACTWQVGSAEGWTPSTFTSSRDKRAAPREQRPEDFMDDEDGLLTEQLQVQKASRTVFTATVVYETIPRVPKPSGSWCVAYT